ncbi:MAG: 2,3-bisphosphoglycerate-independent phosphoglycerate mutase [Clostridia bacterium]|nr:2,3-bisphosphoglycerate-independent phosphoglycerate mutase [Clostridia bacterium]
MKKTKAIIILDGLGESEKIDGNAVKTAKMEVFENLKKEYPSTLIEASGLAVGLPEGQMGNSEVGHLNIGSGRIVYQDSTAISKSIEDGSFYNNSAMATAVENCKKYNSALHIVGLLSDGGVHSKLEHCFACLELAKKNKLDKVYVHCITDGRDVSPTSSLTYLNKLQDKINELGVGEIATIIGRFYIMDRDNRWERVEKGYNLVVQGEGKKFSNFKEAINLSYSNDITDEFMLPTIIGDYKGMNNHDSVIFFNYRTDRAREITRSIIFDDFTMFERKTVLKDLCYVCMTQYDASFENCLVAFPPQTLTNTLGEYLANNGLTQARIAETEKYAHVTFFFNGGVESPNKYEERILVASPKVETYDLQPEMSAYEVTEKALEVLDEGVDVLILNYANCDMVGHTGNFEATQKAVKAVDECLGKILSKIKECGGSAIVTADHGNAEKMVMEDGSVCTSHTTNLVPFILVDEDYRGHQLYKDGKLCDIAPTLLELLHLPQPEEMTGKSLIKH